MKKVAAKKKRSFLLMPEKGAPIVHLELALLNGSICDPEGKDGLFSVTMSMLLRGTKKWNAEEFHKKLDFLGAEIQLGKHKESMRIYGAVLADKLDEFLDLLEEMLVNPEFSPQEFEKMREQLRSSFIDELGSDDDIADRRFQEYLLWGNPYGKVTSGSLETIDKLKIEDLRQLHQTYFRADDFVVGASGGFDKKHFLSRLNNLLAKLPKGSAGRVVAKAPEFKKAKTLLLIDKPDRTQAQVILGSQGVSVESKDYFAMQIANHVFGGGSFSARLMKEVREKRGWAYGAYSWFRSGRKPLYFGMQTVPSNKDAIPAMKLMMELFGMYSKKGITKEEFEFAKKSLVSQSAFLQDTIRKRLDNQVNEIVMELPKGFYDRYQRTMKSITYAQVQKAIKRNMDSSKMFAFVLGTISTLDSDLAGIKGFSKIWKRKFDEAPTDLKKVAPYIVASAAKKGKEISKQKLH
jgi:zinc protease